MDMNGLRDLGDQLKDKDRWGRRSDRSDCDGKNLIAMATDAAMKQGHMPVIWSRRSPETSAVAVADDRKYGTGRWKESGWYSDAIAQAKTALEKHVEIIYHW